MFTTHVSMLDNGPSSSAPAATPAVASPQGQATVAPTTVAPVPMIEVKVNGQVRQYTPEQAKRILAEQEGARGKFEEAAKMRKEVETERAMLKADPIKALMAQGMTKQEAFQTLQDHVINLMAEENLSPEQKEMKALKEFKAQQEEMARRMQQDELSRQEQVQLQQDIQNLDTQLNEAFTKSSILPPEDYLKKQAVMLLQGAHQNGVEMSFDDAVKEVEHNYLQTMNGVLSKADIKKLLNKDVLSKVRKEDMAELKNASPLPKPQVGSQARTVASKAKEPEAASPKTKADFFNSIRGHNYRK